MTDSMTDSRNRQTLWDTVACRLRAWVPSGVPSEGPAENSPGWTRRAWLATEVSALVAVRQARWRGLQPKDRMAPGRTTLGAAGATRVDPGAVQALALHAVDAARSAGATYADARLTRIVEQNYKFAVGDRSAYLVREAEVVGVGVRTLIGGCWGFASMPLWLSEPDARDRIAELARAAVAQAKTAASATTASATTASSRVPGPRRFAELVPTPAVTGTWQTPCRIDPFQVSIEEKLDSMTYWQRLAQRLRMQIQAPQSFLHFARQERVLATSEGSVVTQTLYESGGKILVGSSGISGDAASLRDIWMSGQGWERLLDAQLPEQLRALKGTLKGKPPGGNTVDIGRYTLVCDGATMASILGETLGVATQLDRALGYEASDSGTSFLSDPLAMLGSFQVAAPVVTVTANRSAPTQLATVKWDDEGVAPPEMTLVKDGVLHDFQTTRAQVPWIRPYYERTGRSLTSNGCAAAMNGLHVPLQMRPNLALTPSSRAASLATLIASVKNGVLVENGTIQDVDFQARNGLLQGTLRKIVHGKVAYTMEGGAVQLNTLDFWKNVQAVGDASTAAVYSTTQVRASPFPYDFPMLGDKGRPRQRTSQSTRGVAAVVANQAIIIPWRKA